MQCTHVSQFLRLGCVLYVTAPEAYWCTEASAALLLSLLIGRHSSSLTSMHQLKAQKELIVDLSLVTDGKVFESQPIHTSRLHVEVVFLERHLSRFELSLISIPRLSEFARGGTVWMN